MSTLSLIGIYSFEFYRELENLSIADLKQLLRDCRKDVHKVDLSIYNHDMICFLKKYGYIHKNGFISYCDYFSYFNSKDHNLTYLVKNYDYYILDFYRYLAPVNEQVLYTNMLLVNYFANKYLRYNNKQLQEFMNALMFLNFDQKTIKALCYLNFLNRNQTNINLNLEHMGRIVYFHPLHVKGNTIPEYKNIIAIYNAIKKGVLEDKQGNLTLLGAIEYFN